jgi:hypothetical protein
VDREATGDGQRRLCEVAAVSARQSDVKYDNTDSDEMRGVFQQGIFT